MSKFRLRAVAIAFTALASAIAVYSLLPGAKPTAQPAVPGFEADASVEAPLELEFRKPAPAPGEGARKELRAADPVVITYRPHELELIIAATGKPAVGAVVSHFVRPSEPPAVLLRELIAGAGVLPERSRSAAVRYIADEAGRVSLPAVARATLVMAELGELRAYLALDSELGRGERLELAVPQGRAFRIQDKRGARAQSFALGFEGLAPGLALEPEWDAPSVSWWLRNVNTALLGVQRAAYHGQAGSPKALALWSGERVAEAAFDPTSKAYLPVVLKVMVGRAVIVDLVDFEGRRVRDRWFDVQLVVHLDGVEVSRATVGNRGHSVLFEHVPLGADVVVRVAGEDAAVNEVRAVVPVAGGGPLTLRLEVDKNGGAIVWGRLLDGEGRVMRNAAFDWTLRQRRDVASRGWSGSASASAQTDAEGFFRIPSSSVLDSGAPAERVAQLAISARDGQAVALFSQLPLLTGPVELPLGLGDVRLERAALLAAGRVVDGAGQPVSGADVTVFAAAAGSSDLVDSAAMESAVRLDEQFCAPSDASGRFSVFGLASSSRLFSAASAEGFGTSLRVPHGAGAEQLVLVVERAGSLHGSIHLPTLGDTRWTVAIHPQDPDRVAGFDPLGSPNMVSSSFQREGAYWHQITFWGPQEEGVAAEFSWSNLAAGAYTVGLWAYGAPGLRSIQLVHAWRDVFVVAGEPARDPRLAGIDPGEQLENFAQLGERQD